MYISIFTIDIEKYKSNAYARVCLNNIFLMHREIQSMFPKEEGKREKGDVLFHVNERDTCIEIFIQSKSLPDPSKSQLFCSFAENMMTKSAEDYYSNLKEGMSLRFVIHCRPVIQSHVDGTKNSKKRLIYNKDERIKWLVRKGIENGVAIKKVKENDHIKYLVDKAASMGDIGNKKEIKLPASFYIDGFSYGGNLEILDVNLLKEALVKGIGPSKAYGFGLLILF